MSQITTQLLRLPTVIELTGLSRSEIYRRMEARTFPHPIKLGSRAVAWVAVEIDSWIANCIEQGRQKQSDQATEKIEHSMNDF